jgi:hypothetical protein
MPLLVPALLVDFALDFEDLYADDAEAATSAAELEPTDLVECIDLNDFRSLSCTEGAGSVITECLRLLEMEPGVGRDWTAVLISGALPLSLGTSIAVPV